MGRWFPDEMPQPKADSETLPWWRAAAEHRLVVQRCSPCGKLRHPPSPVCPACHSAASDWHELSGRGRVYTYSVVHRPVAAAQRDLLPFIVVVIELEGADGIRLLSNLVDVEPDSVQVGMPVEVVWEDMGAELAIPRFRAASSPE